MDLTRLRPGLLITLAILAGLTCQLLIGTSYLAASLDPLRQEKGVPVGIVNEDAGPHGLQLVRSLDAHPSPVKWILVKDRTEAQQRLAQKDLFGALVVPANFSTDLDSFASRAPVPALVETWSNNGSSTSGALIASRALEIVVDAARQTARDTALQTTAGAAPAGLGALTIEQGRWLAQPILVATHDINAVPVRGGNGLAPTYLAMGAWIGGYLGAVALERFRPQTALRVFPRTALVAGAALLQGALAAAAAMAIGLTVPAVVPLILFLALGVWMAYAVVSLCLDLLGMPGVLPAFAVLALGLPAGGALYPVGLLPPLYQAIHAWDPFTWLIEGLRTILYAPDAGDSGMYAIELAALGIACMLLSLGVQHLRLRASGKPS